MEAEEPPRSVHPERWLSCVETKPHARHRLIFFGWSGNRCGRGSDCGPRTPVSWSVLAGPDIEVHEVVLPGHGSRMGERCATSATALAAQMAVDLRAILQPTESGHVRPFIFVGFAFGAILAHEVALRMGEYALATKGTHYICTTEMRETLSKRPLLVVAVCCEGPTWDGRRVSAYHKLADATFVEELKVRGGTEELLSMQPELLEIFLPIVRADVQMEETYVADPHRFSPVPTLAIHAGRPGPRPGDTLVTDAQAQLWMQATSIRFVSRVVRLDAFDWFLLESEAGARAVLEAVRQLLGTLSPNL